MFDQLHRPLIHDRGIPADVWTRDYFATYVQRDVRQVLEVRDLESFSTFVGLAAGRTGTELNLSRLGADAGPARGLDPGPAGLVRRKAAC